MMHSSWAYQTPITSPSPQCTPGFLRQEKCGSLGPLPQAKFQTRPQPQVGQFWGSQNSHATSQPYYPPPQATCQTQQLPPQVGQFWKSQSRPTTPQWTPGVLSQEKYSPLDPAPHAIDQNQQPSLQVSQSWESQSRHLTSQPYYPHLQVPIDPTNKPQLPTHNWQYANRPTKMQQNNSHTFLPTQPTSATHNAHNSATPNQPITLAFAITFQEILEGMLKTREQTVARLMHAYNDSTLNQPSTLALAIAEKEMLDFMLKTLQKTVAKLMHFHSTPQPNPVITQGTESIHGQNYQHNTSHYSRSPIFNETNYYPIYTQQEFTSCYDPMPQPQQESTSCHDTISYPQYQPDLSEIDYLENQSLLHVTSNGRKQQSPKYQPNHHNHNQSSTLPPYPTPEELRNFARYLAKHNKRSRAPERRPKPTPQEREPEKSVNLPAKSPKRSQSPLHKVDRYEGRDASSAFFDTHAHTSARHSAKHSAHYIRPPHCKEDGYDRGRSASGESSNHKSNRTMAIAHTHNPIIGPGLDTTLPDQNFARSSTRHLECSQSSHRMEDGYDRGRTVSRGQ